ncbi:MAG TPA: cytochrome c3 family protein [Xanthobacteraceae bacterium]
MTFASARFDHAAVTGTCVSCHNGHTATGKPPNHVATTAPCETCHKSTMTFAGARMNHMGIVGNCMRCHNGVAAQGKPPQHIATNAPCDTCHKSTMTFAGARVDHASLTGPCAQCHNGVTAEGKPAGHMMTTASCNSCHRTMFWTPVTAYRHISPAYVNHGPGVECSSCHVGSSQAVAWKFPQYRSTCAGCHADKYRPQQHVKYERPIKMYYTVSELRDCSSSCHTYTDNTMRTIVQRNFSQHRAFGGGW